MIRIVVGALLLRLFSACLAFVMNVVIPAGPRASFTVLNHPDPFWDGFARYDSGWYYQIARYGYDAGPAVMGGRSNIAFFPVFPLLMRLVRPLFGHGAWAMYAGGIVAGVGLLRAGDAGALSPRATRLAAAACRARGLARRGVPVRVLLRRRLQREHLSAVHGAGFLPVAHPPLADRWTRRRHRGGDARQRHHDVAGAGLDGRATVDPDYQRPPARRRCIGAGRQRIRRIQRLHLCGIRTAAAVGGCAAAVGILRGWRALGRAGAIAVASVDGSVRVP